MTQLRHYDHDGSIRFITFSCHNRLPLLLSDSARVHVGRTMDNARVKYAFRLLTYVFMPEHVHLVILPRAETAVGHLIGIIKQESAKLILRDLEEQGAPALSKLHVTRYKVDRLAVWLRRCYDHNCRTPAAVQEKIDYCHKNPVARGLVSDPSKWTFSSYNWYLGERRVPLSIDTLTESPVSHPSGGAPIGVGA